MRPPPSVVVRPDDGDRFLVDVVRKTPPPALAYRLYDTCARTGRAAEAQARNSLAQEWPSIEDAAIQAETGLREEALPFGGRDGA